MSGTGPLHLRQTWTERGCAGRALSTYGGRGRRGGERDGPSLPAADTDGEGLNGTGPLHLWFVQEPLNDGCVPRQVRRRSVGTSDDPHVSGYRWGRGEAPV